MCCTANAPFYVFPVCFQAAVGAAVGIVFVVLVVLVIVSVIVLAKGHRLSIDEQAAIDRIMRSGGTGTDALRFMNSQRVARSERMPSTAM